MSFFDRLLRNREVQRLLIKSHSRTLLYHEKRLIRLEAEMAKDKDALAELDAELDALESYVKSDEDNDAAEIEARTNRIRTMLAGAQGSGDADDDKVAEVENKLSEIADEA